MAPRARVPQHAVPTTPPPIRLPHPTVPLLQAFAASGQLRAAAKFYKQMRRSGPKSLAGEVPDSEYRRSARYVPPFSAPCFLHTSL